MSTLNELLTKYQNKSELPIVMAQLIPSLTTCLSRMTSGEKRLARRLEVLLDDDYLCWYDIPVGRKNRYPDFIILHPARGLLFLEVKDWRLENIKKISKTRVELLTDHGKITVPNPIEQAVKDGRRSCPKSYDCKSRKIYYSSYAFLDWRIRRWPRSNWVKRGG